MTRMPNDDGPETPAEDVRTNFEKLDDAGLVTDLVYEKYRDSLEELPPELVDEMIKAFNADEA